MEGMIFEKRSAHERSRERKTEDKRREDKEMEEEGLPREGKAGYFFLPPFLFASTIGSSVATSGISPRIASG